jgi:peptidoglycan/xylan/chitin deacetylase (PgdA/CDA1 family)
MIRNKSIPLVEVPPSPAGHDFIACLTHDVDFMKLSHHKFDRTMYGFIYRSVVGVVFEALRRGIPWTRVARNWKAAISLPFIYLGLSTDFLLQFDRYLEIEKDIKSTFFFIPYKNHAGESVSGRHSPRRATKYDIDDARLFARDLVERGYEIGVHGIDAWHSSAKGRQELKRISGINGESKPGIRMHWLCFDENSPQFLDDAGYYYDSTFGYNEKVGYRAGTTQVFRPLSAKNLLELPLHIQDIALFSPKQMHLPENEARVLCDRLLQNASLSGGVVTVLWHLRSLAPERLWGEFYMQLLDKMKEMNAWFGTAFEIVSWFKKRRSVKFGCNGYSAGKARLRLECGNNVSDMPMKVRVYRPCNPGDERPDIEKGYLDIPWNGEKDKEIVLN